MKWVEHLEDNDEHHTVLVHVGTCQNTGRICIYITTCIFSFVLKQIIHVHKEPEKIKQL